MNALLWLLFACMIAGISIFHKHNLRIALFGCGAIMTTRYLVGWDGVSGITGLTHHFAHEWVSVANIFMLITGFELVSQYFSRSNLPILIPRILPDDWKGGLVLLGLVFVCSAFLDNIAAAMIGGTIASTVYKGRVSTGYVAAIVAASNAGGSGSVIGDTTTTMMWISGIKPSDVIPAYIGAVMAFICFAVPASFQQHKYHPIMPDPPTEQQKLKPVFLMIILFTLGLAVTTNVVVNSNFKEKSGLLPWIGLAVWTGILLSSLLRSPHWEGLRPASKGASFLSMLILSASMMPIEELPKATSLVTFGLGLLSSCFDNIPLTALAIKQGGHDPAQLAFSVGFGGSILWFGSSAGVAISNEFPQARSTFAWIRGCWLYIPPAYIVGSIGIVVWRSF